MTRSTTSSYRPRNCSRCFKPGAQMTLFATDGLEVCKGCDYQVNQLVNYLQAMGFAVQLVALDTGEVTGEATIDDPTPNTPHEGEPPQPPQDERGRASKRSSGTKTPKKS